MRRREPSVGERTGSLLLKRLRGRLKVGRAARGGRRPRLGFLKRPGRGVKVAKASGGKVGSGLSLNTLGYVVLKDRPSRLLPRFSSSMRFSMLRAGMRRSHVVYVSSMFLWTIIAGVLGFSITYLFMSALIGPLLFIPPIISLIFGVVLGASAAGVTALVFWVQPRYLAGNLKREIDKNLVYTVNYMTILATAGATTEQIFASLAREGKLFAVQRSARSVMRDVELLGRDIYEAIDDESRTSPSSSYSEVLQGFIATVSTGGDLKSYLMNAAGRLIEERRRLMAKMISNLNLASEVYVAALVALPVIMMTMLTIMGFFGGEVMGGLSAPQTMMVMTYMMLPLTAMAVLVMVDSFMGGW